MAPLIAVDRSEVRPGKLDALKPAIRELAAFVEANEPRCVAYAAHFDPRGAHMTVVQVHPDSASMELHMELAGPRFARFADLVRLQEMHVYGAPSEALLERMRAKARLLGGVALEVHAPHAGFSRPG